MSYQIRLGRKQTLDGLVDRLSQACAAALRSDPEFADLSSKESDSLRAELKSAAGALMRSYDVCGIQAICEENLTPAAWNKKPDPFLSEKYPWDSDEIFRVHLETAHGMQDFSNAMLAAVMRATAKSPQRGARAKELKSKLESAVAGVIGPFLYENPACGQCDLCREAKPISPWKH